MIKLFRISLIVIIPSLALIANLNGQIIYKCIYIDSINISNLESQQASIRHSLSEKGLDEDIIETYIAKFFGDENSFLQVEERILEIYHDSTLIELNYEPSRINQSFQIPSYKLMVKNGQLFKFSPSINSFSISKIPDSSKVFIPTSKSRLILSYNCDEYISQDSVYTIWVTKDLPSQVNPGISVKNVRGAILGFEGRKGTGITKSIIKSLEKPKRVL